MVEKMPNLVERTIDEKSYDPGSVLEKALPEIKEMEGNGEYVTTVIEGSRHAETQGAAIKGALAPQGEKDAFELGKGYPQDAKIIGFASSLMQGGFQRTLDTVNFALKGFREVAGDDKQTDVSILKKVGHDLDFTVTENPWPAAGKGPDGKELTIDQRMDGAPELTREVASKMAHWVKFLINSSFLSKNGEKNFYPMVSHFIMWEAFLKHAMLRIDKDGNRTEGFTSVDEDLGGAFGAAEPFDIIIETNDKKEIKEIKLVFKDPKRAEKFKDVKLLIDMEKLDELDKEYDKYGKAEKNKE